MVGFNLELLFLDLPLYPNLHSIMVGFNPAVHRPDPRHKPAFTFHYGRIQSRYLMRLALSVNSGMVVVLTVPPFATGAS